MGKTADDLGSSSPDLFRRVAASGGGFMVAGSAFQVGRVLSDVRGSTVEVVGGPSVVAGSSDDDLRRVEEVQKGRLDAAGRTIHVAGSSVHVLRSSSEVRGSASQVRGSSDEVRRRTRTGAERTASGDLAPLMGCYPRCFDRSAAPLLSL
jgi:hypothetical protein